MYRALSYSARLDQPAAGKVLETANGGCLVDQKSGTENYKWSVRGKGMETWPKAFSNIIFKKKRKVLVDGRAGYKSRFKRLPVITNGSPS